VWPHAAASIRCCQANIFDVYFRGNPDDHPDVEYARNTKGGAPLSLYELFLSARNTHYAFAIGAVEAGGEQDFPFKQMVHRMKADYRVDARRVFVTGLSALDQ
jgi:hypothetical protein